MRRSGRPKVTRRVAVFLALAFVLTAAACGSASTGGSSQAGGNQITIGVIAPLSGAGGYWGNPQLGGTRVAADEANKNGGIQIGGTTYKVNVVSDDAASSDPAATKQILNKQLFSEHANFFAVNGDPLDPVVVPVTEPRKVVVLDNTANNKFVRSPYQFVVNGYPSPWWASVPFFSSFKTLEPNVKTLYGFGIDATFDHNHIQWEMAAAQSQGFQSEGTTYYQSGTVDFAPILTPIVAKNPDMIVFGTPSGDTPTIVKTLRGLGYKGVIGSAIANADMSLMLGSGGSAMDGYYQADVLSYPENAAYQSFASQYASTGLQPNTLGAYYYLYTKLFFKALQQAGSTTDGNAVVKAFSNVSIADPFVQGSPTVRFQGQDIFGEAKQLVLGLSLNQIVNGQVTTRKVLDTAGQSLRQLTGPNVNS